MIFTPDIAAPLGALLGSRRPRAEIVTDDDAAILALIREHYEWTGRDEVRASALYADDAALEFPQSGERIRGRQNIIAFRTAYPAKVTIDMYRTSGSGTLWVNESTILYDGAEPHGGASIMEFAGGKVVRERIYIGARWEPPTWRAQWVEMME